ncbi:MAG TPA: PEGA domain-containing protein [Ignavibacteriales bacterium]|nr:PEGA domain-containing protein [Ignavibacteriales bacterium]
MKNIVLKCVIAVICVNMAVGCATIINSATQDIQVFSNPSDAEVWVDGFNRGKTPTMLNLERKHSYIIKIKKEGYKDTELTIKRESSPWIIGNVIFGGVIGCAVDFITGAAYRLSPDKLEINMDKTDAITQGIINIPAEQFDKLDEISLVNDKGEEQIIITLE